MQDFAKINQKQTNFCNLEFPLKTKYHFLKKENKNLFIYFYKFLQGRGVREKCNNFSRDLLIRKLTKQHPITSHPIIVQNWQINKCRTWLAREDLTTYHSPGPGPACKASNYCKCNLLKSSS